MSMNTWTAVLACKGQETDIIASIECVKGQCDQLLLIPVKGFQMPELSEEAAECVLPGTYDTIYEGYQAAKERITGDYVQFLVAGDVVIRGDYEQVKEAVAAAEMKRAKDMEKNAMLRLLQIKGDNLAAFDKCKPMLAWELLDLKEIPQNTVITFHNILFRTEMIRNVNFDSAQFAAGERFVWEVLAKHPYVLDVNGVIQNLNTLFFAATGNMPCATEKAWYMEPFTAAYLPFLEKIKKEAGEVPEYIQYAAYYAVVVRYEHNRATKNKQVLRQTEELETFESLVADTLQYIDNSIIFNFGKFGPYMSQLALTTYLIRLKYHGDVEFKLQKGTYTTDRDYFLTFGGIIFEKLSAQKVFLDLFREEDGCFFLEVSYSSMCPEDKFSLYAKIGYKEIPLERTKRFGDINYFGKTIHKKQTYALRIPFEDIQPPFSELTFYVKVNGDSAQLTYKAGRFPGLLNPASRRMYLHRGPFLARFTSVKCLRFMPYTKLQHFKYEIRYLMALFPKKRAYFSLRIKYWLTRPYFKHKHIWITFDKLYKAGDNGEYFFRYAKKQKDGIEVRYLANKGYEDTERLKKEGMKPLIYGTTKHMLYFLNASAIAATHANIPIYFGNVPMFQAMKDLFDAEVVCIQHGLAVQYMPHNLNAQYDNTRKFYCASPYEIENLKKPEYGYYDKDSLELVGVSRYDGLVNRDQRQILLIPTWRNYIAMPTSLGNTRPYSETFKETVYFKTFNSLINNQKLIQTAKECNYKIVYLLHPTLNNQLEDFTPGDGVIVKQPVGVSYEQILTESSLMITDFSGVQFDFAYMRKPIVYYHTPELPAHYDDGGFFYDTMGFGPICADEDSLVEELCRQMKQECQMDDFYKKRADDFFAYDDHNNCARVYEKLKAFDEECLTLKKKNRFWKKKEN